MSAWSVLFMGPVASGKTSAIRAISDIEVVDTEVAASDETRFVKQTTTVSMDVGVLNLAGGEQLRLYGAPGQERFDFMWEILLEQTKALIILVNHSSPNPHLDLLQYMNSVVAALGNRRIPLAVGVTHADESPEKPLSIYDEALADRPPVFVNEKVPLFRIDARNPNDVRALVIAVAAMLEMTERFGSGGRNG